MRSHCWLPVLSLICLALLLPGSAAAEDAAPADAAPPGSTAITATDDSAAPPPDVYVPPTKEEWQAAGLKPEEYQRAVGMEASLEEWLDMHQRRRSNQVVGWSCIGLAILAPIIEVTVMFGGDVRFDEHPNMEVYIIASVAAFAILTSGVFVLAATPGPEDVVPERKQAENPLSFELGPTRVTPSPFGLNVTF
ncbi:MAG TPA: hypothetical protein PK668_17260 [Myxococcota bacterium]|nr:hypothetical protein [Myxococcota bacterium]HRY94909.1 hypothetical protein [Myxococcota bacterium]